MLVAIEKMPASWEIVDREGDDIHWDIWWSNLSAEINSAEVEQDITSEQAWYLRRKYLRMKTEEGI